MPGVEIASPNTALVTPPAHLRFLYRTLGFRLEGRYRPWVVADFADPRWFRRFYATHVVLVLVSTAIIVGAVWLQIHRLAYTGMGGFVGAMVGPLLFPGRARAAATRRQLLPGSEPTWWSELSNGAWMAMTAGTALLVLIIFLAILPTVAGHSSEAADELPAVACASPPPEVVNAVLERIGLGGTFLPAVQVPAPGAALLVRVGPPNIRYAIVRPVGDGTFDVAIVDPVTAGLYAPAVIDVDRCA